MQAEIRRLEAENQKLRRQIENMSQDIYLQALDHSSDSVCMITGDGFLQYANQKYCDSYGVVRLSTPDGVMYDTKGIQFSVDQFNEVKRNLEAAGGTYQYQMEHTNRTTGQTRTIQVTASRIDANGQELIWFFMRDVTELIQSRDEYRELSYLMDSILENIPVYVFVKDVDNDLRYVYWNKAFADFSKIPASKVIGRTDYEIFPVWADAEKFRKDDLELLANRESLNYTETYEAADGTTRLCQTLKTLVYREGRGPLLIGVSWDLTNMQNVEQELVRERLRADQSDRLKSTFIANMSHEIRTPLNAIVGFSDLLAEAEDPESRHMFADIIKHNSDQLLQLINDILDLSKIEAGTLEYVRQPMDLTEVFRCMYDTLKDKTHEGVRLVFDNAYPNQVVTVNEDRVRITQVVTNLINNAIKFTDHGTITFGFRIKDGCIEAHVSDTGKGIAPEKLGKVFDRFVKLDPFAQGTGLGLAISSMIVNIIGGKIWVESEVGRGSTFRFTIPYQSYGPAGQPTTAAPAPAPAPEPERMRILVAEDVESNYLLVKAVIGKKFDLIWARDGEEAVKAYRQNNPHLVLMDVKMPNMDGVEATKMIRKHSTEVPIIALSAFAYDSDKKRMFDAGANHYLTKPLKRADLNMIIDEFLNDPQ